jgi:hypothetical protein
MFIKYITLHKNRLMDNVYITHGFSPKKEGRELELHFHNTDLSERDFKIKDTFAKEKFRWDGKHFLFIPKGRVNTMVKKGKYVTI